MALFAFVWVEVNCTSLIRGLIVLRFFDKRSEFFSDREDSKLPLNMCRSIGERRMHLTSVQALLMLDQFDLSAEFPSVARD